MTVEPRVPQHPPEPSDDDLVRRLRLGDEAALAAAYDRFSVMVLAVATRVCRDRHAAEDVAQQVFLQLWTQPGAYDPGRASLRSWLAVLSHRRAVDWVRRESLRHKPDHRHEVASAPSAEDQVIEATLLQRVTTAIDGLPATYREVVRMLYYEDLSVKEIAVRLGIPEGTTKTRLRTARQRLAADLGAAGLVGAW